MYDYEKIYRELLDGELIRINPKEVEDFLLLITREKNIKDNTKISYAAEIEILAELYSKFPGLRIDERIDDYFWIRIYTTLRAIYNHKGRNKEAIEANKKALQIIERMLKSREFRGIKKELLYYKGAMHYFLKEKEKAITTLKQALILNIDLKDMRWFIIDMKEERNMYDKYLSEHIMRDLIWIITRIEE